MDRLMELARGIQGRAEMMREAKSWYDVELRFSHDEYDKLLRLDSCGIGRAEWLLAIAQRLKELDGAPSPTAPLAARRD